MGVSPSLAVTSRVGQLFSPAMSVAVICTSASVKPPAVRSPGSFAAASSTYSCADILLPDSSPKFWYVKFMVISPSVEMAYISYTALPLSARVAMSPLPPSVSTPFSSSSWLSL